MKRIFVLIFMLVFGIGLGTAQAGEIADWWGFDDEAQFLAEPHTFSSTGNVYYGDGSNLTGVASDSWTDGGDTLYPTNGETILRNETLGGVSTYKIPYGSGVTPAIVLGEGHLSGRIGIIHSVNSPTVELPALSSVTPIAIFIDTSVDADNRDDSGVSVWSQTNNIYSGVGSTATTGTTVFINSGNTGFTMVLKALKYGASFGWKVVSFNGNTLRRP